MGFLSMSGVSTGLATTAPGIPIGKWFKSFLWWATRSICSWCDWCFGLVSLLIGLAVLATIPVLQFLTLGYLLESGGRIARSGRLRNGFIGIRQTSRIGSIALGTWLLLWPARFVSDVWYTSRLVDPDSLETSRWRLLLVVLTTVILIQICWAWYRGGKLRHFFWPAPLRLKRELFRGGKYVRCRDAVWEFFASLRLGYYFYLGWRGFVGAVIWLFFPLLLFVGATLLPQPAGFFAGFVSVVLLIFVFSHLPFLQIHFAVEGKIAAMFEVQRIRQLSRRSPLTFSFALTITLLFALPLYLLKIELTPKEVFVLPSLIFVAFIFPARLLTGWALSRAYRHQKDRHLVFRWMSRILGIAVVAAYILFIFFTRYTSWHGHWSLLEQHAFMVPVPF